MEGEEGDGKEDWLWVGGRRWGGGSRRGDRRVDDDLRLVWRAGVVERGRAFHAEGEGPADDFDAADEPCEQRAGRSTARLPRKEV